MISNLATLVEQSIFYIATYMYIYIYIYLLFWLNSFYNRKLCLQKGYFNA